MKRIGRFEVRGELGRGAQSVVYLGFDPQLQREVAIKTLHFDEGVNMTLGLPIIRTSPDHGTAFGIAGKNIAHPGAMIAAIQMARQAAQHRRACAL